MYIKSITENFKIIVSRQNEMGYYFPSILQASGDIDAIQKTEQALGAKFSKQLIELYSFANGTKRDEKPLGMIGLLPIYIFMNLSDAEEYYKTSIGFEDSFITWDTKYKPENKLFPFLQNCSGDCYWVDLNEGSENYNKIYFTNTLPHSPDYIFNSLETMFESIAECYSTKVFFLDEENYLDEDYEKWGVICKKYNPELKYWDDYINGL